MNDSSAQQVRVAVGVQAGGGPGETRIAIRGLDFFYGGTQALKHVNLDLPERRVTGMIGPSG